MAKKKLNEFQKRNRDRADRIATLITGYSGDMDAYTDLCDFLADARHYCDEKDIDFAECDGMAYSHYVAEVVEARTNKACL